MARPGFPSPLPIDTVLPELLAALEAGPNAVLVADPGAGKTTRVPLALLDAPWRDDGRIIVLEPRRLAARAAARRMAETLGEVVGETVGYRVRLETRVSGKTRIEVVTEGVFTRMILDDPELSGISAVLFDEFHERSLDGDLGLALALDAQGALREDLRLLPMSATIDAKAVANLMGGCPVAISQGRSFPVETRHLGRTAARGIEEQMAAAVKKALGEEEGSILAFLPGQKEILKTASLLEGRVPANTDIAPLYGALDGKAQDAAIRPAATGRRKVVLSTDIAQTSLTIEGIRVVIDSGLSRVPKFEPSTGLTRLETVRVSKAGADQRRGRAGRTQEGVCYRLWDEPQTAALPPADRPAILEADLTRLVLDLALWGESDPAKLSFLDPPPKGAWSEAVELLKALDALDDLGRMTEAGKRLSALPLPPRVAHMLVEAGTLDAGGLASEIAVILTEQGIAGRASDLRERLSVLRRGKGRRIDEAKALARRWRKLAGIGEGDTEAETAGEVLALAYPERVAQGRDGKGGFRLANGRGALLEQSDPLAGEDFLVVADIQGTAARGRIALAAPIDKETIERLFAPHIEEKTKVTIDANGAIRAKRLRRYGAVVLDERNEPAPDPEAIADALLSLIAKKGVARLPWTKAQKATRARITYLRKMLGDDWPDLSDEALDTTLEDWLKPHLAGKTKLDQIDAECLGNALSGLLPWGKMPEVDRLLPSHFDAPSGSSLPIDYDAPEGPTLRIRVQELFGLDRHPTIADGKVPLILELLSPAQRPIQITRDLPGFWRGSWADVKADMRGRYPKHPWPDDPLNERATSRAKPRK
ncbi:ATP-dependent helicase HrpB [Rhizobiales bacterium]|uniref:ATP-dependent helicase HrpB n=1 Tax=Hongsoonwoonella zoysiae TaxID=2821844 RepID=UPI0015618BE8|nr:ATP-dependent helicase HrpB [Hongsoonwoonella zoysiae]NRG16167.1 ATP-dependent helicase HrpB [Hongsoonwoonella zoysiae]